MPLFIIERESGQEFKHGRYLESGDDTEAMECAPYWPAPHGFCLIGMLPYRTQNQQPRNGTKYNRLDTSP